MEPFPKQPQKILDLWTEDSSKAKVFRENARTINNAVCLTSLKTSERRSGFTPSVIFQGKVHHRIGALIPNTGENPKFAQLYVCDPSLESTTRFQNMSLPTQLSLQHKEYLKECLLMIQNELHKCNPFIKDFLQIMEIPEDELLR